MTQAITARRDGDSFQARIFWMKAARLLAPNSPIVRIGFEKGPKSYDDIWVEYDPSHAPKDQMGVPITREHIQCKWHVSPDNYGYKDLVDPEFINANSISLLQRAHQAQKTFAPTGKGIRFRLLTNWRLNKNDPLCELIYNRSHTLRLDRLFGSKTDNSKMGHVRKLWREHLNIKDNELLTFARSLSFTESTDSLEDMRNTLDPLFQMAGLRQIPISNSSFPYDDIVFQWFAQGRSEFDAKTLRDACEGESLIVGDAKERPIIYGIKSFEHPTDQLEDRCTSVLDLVSNFDKRQIRPEADWKTTIYPQLTTFLHQAAKSGDRIRLIIDAHLTLSYAAGTILNIKSGRLIELEQRIIGKEIWAPDDHKYDPSWPTWLFESLSIEGGGVELAVAISLTHDVKAEVLKYLDNTSPRVGTVLLAYPSTGSSARSVMCGRHAFDLAEGLTAKIKQTRSDLNYSGYVHLFAACPGTFAFFLGQRQIATGPNTMYEFDFEDSKTYQPSLSFPVIAAEEMIPKNH